MFPFYANDAVFNGLARRSAAQLKLIIDQGPERGYFPDMAKSIFVADNSEDEEAVRWGFER